MRLYRIFIIYFRETKSLREKVIRAKKVIIKKLRDRKKKKGYYDLTLMNL